MGKEIIVENGRAIGVIVEKSGKETTIHAPIIISAAGIRNTIHKLLPSKVVKSQWPSALTELKTIRPSCGHLNMFIGINDIQEELELPKYNSWVLNGNDDLSLNKLVDDYYENKTKDPPFMFVGFPSAKDSAFKKEHPGKHLCTIVSEMPYEMVEPWENEKVKRRGEQYESMKKEIESNLLKSLCKVFPELKDKVIYTDIGTPLSNNFYIGSFRGESYGLEHTPKRFRATCTQPRTPIEGFYITGQDVCSAGIAGAMFGGYSCAFAIDFRIFLKNIGALVS